MIPSPSPRPGPGLLLGTMLWVSLAWPGVGQAGNCDEERTSVGRVVCFKEQGGALEPVSHGSGFVVDGRGHLVTNHHVVDGCTKLEVFFTADEHSALSVVDLDKDRDLALLKMDQPLRTPLVLFDGGGRRVASGVDLHAIGFPGIVDGATLGPVLRYVMAVVNDRPGSSPPPPRGSMDASCTYDRLSGIKIKDNLSVLMLPTALHGGGSGGPVLDECGRVVGIATYKIQDEDDSIGFAVDVAELLPILERNHVEAARASRRCGTGGGRSRKAAWPLIVTGLLGVVMLGVATRRRGIGGPAEEDAPAPPSPTDKAPPGPPQGEPGARSLLLDVPGRSEQVITVEVGRVVSLGADGGVCDVSLPLSVGEARIALKHLELRRGAAGTEARDPYSGVGVFMDDAALPPGEWCKLASGSVLRLGDSGVHIRRS